MDHPRVVPLVQEVDGERYARDLKLLKNCYGTGEIDVVQCGLVRPWRQIRLAEKIPRRLLASEAEALRILRAHVDLLKSLTHEAIKSILGDAAVSAIQETEDEHLGSERAFGEYVKKGPGRFIDRDGRIAFAGKVDQVMSNYRGINRLSHFSELLDVGANYFAALRNRPDTDDEIWLPRKIEQRLEWLLREAASYGEGDFRNIKNALNTECVVVEGVEIVVPSKSEVAAVVKGAVAEEFVGKHDRVDAWIESIRDRARAGLVPEEALLRLASNT